jgi:hypothetical protein
MVKKIKRVTFCAVTLIISIRVLLEIRELSTAYVNRQEYYLCKLFDIETCFLG